MGIFKDKKDELTKIVENGGDVCTTKKANVAYWDTIDGVCYDAITEIAKMSTSPIDDEEIDEILCECGAEVREIIIKQLKEIGGVYPFVDENF
jgi:hypothetical protein